MHLDPPFLIAILIGLSVHECAHAYVAYLLGDPTAKYDGRLTLNPIAHIDPMGAIFFLFAGFGWGKPVPVNPRYFNYPRRDNALVSIAGPISNLLLALLAFVILRSLDLFSALSDTGTFVQGGVAGFFVQVLVSMLFVNLGLMAFNLLPVSPLDGSKILQSFIPLQFEDLYEQYLQYGPYLLLLLLIIDRVSAFSFLSWWIETITSPILRVMGIG